MTTTTCDQLVEGVLKARGQEFPFYLEHSLHNLGPAGDINYYYIPVSRLRDDDPERDVSNFRSCIGYWYALMHDAGLGEDPIQQSNFVLATSHALFLRDKGPQNICRDAFLRPRHVHPEKLTLSVDIRRRIQDAIASRDQRLIRAEMGTALDAKQFAPVEARAISRAMDEWVGRGVELLSQSELEGLDLWHREVDVWTKRFRKRSDPRVRTFLNAFAYEAKLAFYLCYANFWIGLLPWLEQEHNLDQMSMRFLRLWHNQNQPIEVPHGRTQGGIIYPTTAGRQILLPAETGNRRLHKLSWTTDHIGCEVIPDVLWGQVLALHPLCWILLARTDLRDLVGTWIASPCFDLAIRSGRVDDVPEYWGMVEAVLTAAYLYQSARLGYESERTKQAYRGVDLSTSNHSGGKAAPTKPASATPEALLRDYVEGLKSSCTCGGHYSFVAADLPTADGDSVLVPVVCAKCGLPFEITITLQKLKQFLQPDEV